MRLIALMGMSSEQMEFAKSALRQRSAISDFALCVVKDGREVRRAFSQTVGGVLVVDARAYVEGKDGVSLAAEVASAGGNIRVVLVNVDDTLLVRVCETEYAYLLPLAFDEQMLTKALDKALALLDRSFEQPLVVCMRRRDLVIQPGKVAYVESDLRKIRFHVSGEAVEAYGKLSEVMAQLPSRFVQCHKSFVVNMGFVEEFDRDYLLLTTGDRIPVSQKRRKATREAFITYVGRVL